jgi:hypothetical protein
MTPETLQSALQNQPFRQLTLRTMGGGKYQVSDPALARISGTTLTFLAAGPGKTTSWVADADIPSVTSLSFATPETP